MKDLATRGHHLTILTTDLIQTENPNITQIVLQESYEIFHKEFNFVKHRESEGDNSDLLVTFFSIMAKVIDYQLSHPEVRKLIDNPADYKFDVLIVEYMNFVPVLAFAEIYNCPIILITSMEPIFIVHEEIGNEVNPVIHPEFSFPYIDGTLTFSERWKSLSYYLRFRFLFEPKFQRHCESTIREYFPEVKTTIPMLKERIQLLMVNTNPAMGFVKPLLPNTIQLGFMHIEAAKPLPDGKLKKFLDNSKNGVIYICFGSNVQSKDLSPEILRTFVRVFGSLNYEVLWKFEADELPNKPDNVMILNWVPQSDVLAHPNMKLFITHGGLQSIEEAIDRAVPMILIPFFGDQESNAKRIVQRGVGYHLALHSLNEEALFEAIVEMMKPKYKENIVKLRELVYDEPMTSRERAVWWTEYVIRHKGAEHFKYSGKTVPFYQKFWLDFIGLAFFFFVAVLKLTSIFYTAVQRSINKEKLE